MQKCLALLSVGVNGKVSVPVETSHFQSSQDGWQCVVDVPALVPANNSPSPVNQRQVFLEVEENTDLDIIYQAVFEGKQRL